LARPVHLILKQGGGELIQRQGKRITSAYRESKGEGFESVRNRPHLSVGERGRKERYMQNGYSSGANTCKSKRGNSSNKKALDKKRYVDAHNESISANKRKVVHRKQIQFLGGSSWRAGKRKGMGKGKKKKEKGKGERGR